MAQDPPAHFATISCNCSTWMFSIGRVVSEGPPEGTATVMLLCGNCNSNFQMNLLGAPESPRGELLKALALGARSLSREALHELVEEAVVKDVMES